MFSSWLAAALLFINHNNTTNWKENVYIIESSYHAAANVAHFQVISKVQLRYKTFFLYFQSTS